MEIGIISDIHAGLSELKSELEQLNGAKVDHILCAGDLVDFGDHGEAVINLITDAQIPCVQGNHDHAARRNQQQSKPEGGVKRSILRAKTLDLLEQLPQYLRFEWENTSILLTHATPWGGEMYVYPDSTIPLFRRVVREANADVTILGHTHRPMWIQVGERTIVNAGSVSQNYELGFGTYGILSLPEREFHLFNVETGEQVRLEPKIYRLPPSR